MNLHLRLADQKGEVRWLRPNIDPELCANSWIAPWDPRDDFHVYGCHVAKDSITWFIDGKQVAQKPNQYWHLPMNVTLSLGLRHPHIGWVGQDIKPVPQAATSEGFPTTMEVDYVRVWESQ
jgi:beta-glucanase (GH16 family)